MAYHQPLISSIGSGEFILSIRVVTDSSCDLPASLVAEHQIEVVPLTVRIDNQEYHEGVTISSTEFPDMMRHSSELPKTSQPPPQAFLDAFERVTQGAEDAVEVLCLTLSSKLSGTFQSATIAQKMFRGKVRVIDSLSGTLGLGIMATEAAKLTKLGHSLNEIGERVLHMREQMNVFVGLDTLENAVKGGRIHKVQAAVAQILRLKILVHVVEGRVEVCGKARGKKNMLAAFINAMEVKGIDYRQRIIGISHVDNESEAIELKEAIQKRFMPQQILISPMGSTIATYAGIGAIALAY